MFRTKSDYDRIIITSKNVTAIANAVGQKLNRRLTKPECADLLDFIRSHRDFDGWYNKPTLEISHVTQTLTKLYLGDRFPEGGRRNRTRKADIVDVHEILKRQLGTTAQEPHYETLDNVDVDGNPTDLRLEDIENKNLANGPEYVLQGILSGQTVNVDEIEHLGNLDHINVIDRLLNVDKIGNVVGFLGKTNDVELQTMLNPQAAYRKTSIVLDTRYRVLNDDGTLKFSWGVLTSAVNSQGVVNSLIEVKQLISIRCLNLRIPYSNSNDVVFTTSYKRVSMLIEEFNAQSVVAQENRRYHFIFEAALDGTSIDLRAMPNESNTFTFSKPITQLDTLTVSFGNPLEPVIFDTDRLGMAITYSNPAVFTSIAPHNLQTGDQVYVSGFTTNNTNADKVTIDYVNRSNGFNVSVIDANTIELYAGTNYTPLDLTGLVAPINPLSVQVYFGSKRIFIPLELTYIAQHSSN